MVAFNVDSRKFNVEAHYVEKAWTMMQYKHERDTFNVETRSMEQTLFIEVTKIV